MRGFDLHPRQQLHSGWQFCATEPGAPTLELLWQPLDRLQSAAGALRDLGQWSLDAPALRFDSKDWWYRLVFDAPAGHSLTDSRTVLGFDGLATLAQVWLNDTLLLSSDNAFINHASDVSTALQATGNVLLMRFAAIDTFLKQRRPRPRWRAPMVENQQLRWVRTSLLGRTPGWSPPAAIVGPWRDVWLSVRQQFEVRDLRLETQVEGADGTLRCTLELASFGAECIATVQLRVARDGLTHNQTLAVHGDCYHGELRVPDVALWWPHTHGEPALYQVSLMLHLSGGAPDQVVDAGRVGFRTLLVDATNDDFAIRVNGVRLFCRGACWTPLDVVNLHASTTACEAALRQVRDAGMNMLRVCGTMVYEEDHFYDCCDRLGILIWQDLMFANLDYPWDDTTFRASVTTEVTQQLQRLSPHACLAVLCGNSEVAQQAAMWGAPREQWSSPMFAQDLAQLCHSVAPQVFYWPSSAWGGAFPHQASAGTTSYYGVGAYLRPIDDARRCELKFATECLAFANVPPDSTLKRMPGGLSVQVHHPNWKARSPRDLGAGWDFDDVRDHYVSTLFGVDPTRLRHADPDRYLTLSRMATGEVMAQAFAQWRQPNSTCSGALVLFLRDLWPGASWGLMDDAGIPKACFYALQRVLKPIAVLLSDEGVNGLAVHLINDTASAVPVTLTLEAWQGGEVRVGQANHTLVLPAHGAQSLSAMALLDHFIDLNHAYQFGPRPCDVVIATMLGDSGQPLGQSFYLPDGIGNPLEADVGLSAKLIHIEHGIATLRLRSLRLALGVHFDVPGFVAQDDFFHLAPGADTRVTLHGPFNADAAHGTVSAINSRLQARF